MAGSSRCRNSTRSKMDVEVSHDQFYGSSFKTFGRYRRSRILTDVTLIVGGFEYHAHRLVLAANSGYFETMFTSGFIEARVSRIELQMIHPVAIELLIRYMYTGRLTVTSENVEVLLHTGSYLLMSPIVAACTEFYKGQLGPSNALGIRRFAQEHQAHELEEAAEYFIKVYFRDVMGHTEFLNLSPEEMEALVSRNDLFLPKEEILLQGLLRWVEVDERSRLPSLPGLLGHVRLLLVPPIQYNRIISKTSPGLGSTIQEALTGMLTLPLDHESGGQGQDDHDGSIVPFNHWARPRSPDSSPEVIVITSTRGLVPSFHLQMYSFGDGEWSSLPRTPTSLFRGKLTAQGGRLFALTGGLNSPTLRSVMTFDLDTKEWRRGFPRMSWRTNFCVTVLDGNIYLTGGQVSGAALNTTECFNINTQRWTYKAEMGQGRSFHASAALDGKLYVAGGYKNGRALRSVEVYDPMTDSWTTGAPLLYPRSGLGLVEVGGSLFALGGMDGKQCFRSGEVLRPGAAGVGWTLISDMNFARRNFGATVHNQLIYVIGGNNDVFNSLLSVEVYEPQRDHWRMFPHPISLGGQYTSAATLTLAYRPRAPGEFGSSSAEGPPGSS